MSQSPAPARHMRWTCLTCRGVFYGPVDRAPHAGCALCGSRSVVDLNLEPIDVKTTSPASNLASSLAARLYAAAADPDLTRRTARALLREAGDHCPRAN